VTEYLKDGPFTVPAPGTDAFRRGWDLIWGDTKDTFCRGCGEASIALLCAECVADSVVNGSGTLRVSWDEPDEPSDDMASLDGAPDLEHPPACEEQDSCQPGHAKDT